MARLQFWSEAIWRQGRRGCLVFSEGAMDLQKDGKPAGRLLLLNINAMVPGIMPAKIEVDHSLLTD